MENHAGAGSELQFLTYQQFLKKTYRHLKEQEQRIAREKRGGRSWNPSSSVWWKGGGHRFERPDLLLEPGGREDLSDRTRLGLG